LQRSFLPSPGCLPPKPNSPHANTIHAGGARATGTIVFLGPVSIGIALTAVSWARSARRAKPPQGDCDASARAGGMASRTLSDWDPQVVGVAPAGFALWHVRRRYSPSSPRRGDYAGLVGSELRPVVEEEFLAGVSATPRPGYLPESKRGHGTLRQGRAVAVQVRYMHCRRQVYCLPW